MSNPNIPSDDSASEELAINPNRYNSKVPELAKKAADELSPYSDMLDELEKAS